MGCPEAKLAWGDPEMDACLDELTRADPPSSNGFRKPGFSPERNIDRRWKKSELVPGAPEGPPPGLRLCPPPPLLTYSQGPGGGPGRAVILLKLKGSGRPSLFRSSLAATPANTHSTSWLLSRP